jgi:hypothetical protein
LIGSPLSDWVAAAVTWSYPQASYDTPEAGNSALMIGSSLADWVAAAAIPYWPDWVVVA